MTHFQFCLTAILPLVVLFFPACRPQTPSESAERDRERIKRLNDGFSRPDHPLRKKIETFLEAIPESERPHFRRKLLDIEARNPEGNEVEIRWEEYRYKPWGGYFFVATRRGMIQVERHGDQWNIASLSHDTPLPPLDPDRQDVAETDADLFLRRWNRDANRFEEFDDSSQSRFTPERPAVILIHGMNENSKEAWIAVIAERIAAIEKDTNILAADWGKYSKSEAGSTWSTLTLPVNTAGKIPYVSGKVGEYLFGKACLDIKPENAHLIGFSHGAHIGGMIGANQAGKIKRLTLLDPSTRTVHWNSKNRFGDGWNAESAMFIDMYRTSGWAGTGRVRGYRVFYVLEKDCDLHSTFGTYADHRYAPKWFASTIGQDHSDFGYSISMDSDDPPSSETGWTGLIVSTLPKPGDREGLEDGKSSLVPFPKKGEKSKWSKDSRMYKELLKVTDIVVKEVNVVLPPGKDVFTHGDQADLLILLENNFDRINYFNTGIWGFVSDRKIIGHAWLSGSEVFSPENSVPLLSAEAWGTTELKFQLSGEEGNKANAVLAVRLPKRSVTHGKFGRSKGEFYLHVELGGVLNASKAIDDLNEDDNFGMVRIRIE